MAKIFCLFIKLCLHWQKSHWQSPIGKVPLAKSDWQSPIGKVPLAKSHWQSPSGKVPVAKSHWQSPIGKVPLAKSYWQSPIGKVPLAKSHWQSLIKRQKILAIFPTLFFAKTERNFIIPILEWMTAILAQRKCDFSFSFVFNFEWQRKTFFFAVRNKIHDRNKIGIDHHWSKSNFKKIGHFFSLLFITNAFC